MRYRMADRFSAAKIPDVWRHEPGKILDQGREGACVGFGCAQLLQSSPYRQEGIPSGFDIYHEAQRIDEFPDHEEGTSVRAGLEVLRRLGYIKSFHWAADMMEICRYIHQYGPVVAGHNWYGDDMDADGVINLSGRATGGHCVLYNGYDLARGLLFGVNSWGSDWGVKGMFAARLEQVDRELRRGGVAAGVVENKIIMRS
jgi:hypothetical protein